MADGRSWAELLSYGVIVPSPECLALLTSILSPLGLGPLPPGNLSLSPSQIVKFPSSSGERENCVQAQLGPSAGSTFLLPPLSLFPLHSSIHRGIHLEAANLSQPPCWWSHHCLGVVSVPDWRSVCGADGAAPHRSFGAWALSPSLEPKPRQPPSLIFFLYPGPCWRRDAKLLTENSSFSRFSISPIRGHLPVSFRVMSSHSFPSTLLYPLSAPLKLVGYVSCPTKRLARGVWAAQVTAV